MGNISSAKLSEISRKLDVSGVPWGIFAGAAAYILVASRDLKDIDILIPSDAGEKVSRCFPTAELEFRGDRSIDRIVLLDVEIIAGLSKGICLEMDAEMISRLSRHDLFGADVAVLSLEDNIAFKAVLGRGPQVGKHDWEDITGMLRQNSNVDWDYLQFRLENCGWEDPSKIFRRLKMICKRL